MSMVRRWPATAAAAASRIGAKPSAGLTPCDRDVAEIAQREEQLGAALDVVGAEAAQGLADGLGGEVAAARSHRTRLHGRAQDRDLALAADQVSDGFPAHGVALKRVKVKKRPMWDRLLTDCHVATMDPPCRAPFGAIEDGAIGIQDGRIVRVGRRIDLAGYRAQKVEPLGGAWVTPGADRLPHPSGLRRQPGRRVRAEAERRQLRGDRPRRRRNRLLGQGDPLRLARASWSSRRGRGFAR